MTYTVCTDLQQTHGSVSEDKWLRLQRAAAEDWEGSDLGLYLSGVTEKLGEDFGQD